MKFFTIIFLLLLFTSHGIFAQKPEPPVLKYISIDPETGSTNVFWDPSPTASTDYYLIYENTTSGGRAISPPIYGIQYPVTYDLPHYQSVGFAVVGVDDGGVVSSTTYGDWSRIDSTIYLEAEFDTCESVIRLSWNEYNGWRGAIAEYQINRYMAPGMYLELARVPANTTTLELANVLPNQTYDLFISAVHTGGSPISNSNRNAVETRTSILPVSINADYATIGPGNSIDLSFTVAGSPGNTTYNLLRSNSFDGSYALIQSLKTDGAQIAFNDNIPFSSGIQYYRLEVLNSCGITGLQSNRANNIILSGSFVNLTASLEWNDYRDWRGGLQQYNVIRTIGRNNPRIDTINNDLNTFLSDDVSGLIDYQNPQEGLVCYSIQGVENRNDLGIQGKSLSNQMCFSVNAQVRMPNAFIPNDAEPENQVFEPIFSFLPEHYELIIYNRLGLKVWEGSEPWDGLVNGKYVPEGVYLYFLRVFNYSSDIAEYNGKVTVLYR